MQAIYTQIKNILLTLKINNILFFCLLIPFYTSRILYDYNGWTYFSGIILETITIISTIAIIFVNFWLLNKYWNFCKNQIDNENFQKIFEIKRNNKNWSFWYFIIGIIFIVLNSINLCLMYVYTLGEFNNNVAAIVFDYLSLIFCWFPLIVVTTYLITDINSLIVDVKLILKNDKLNYKFNEGEKKLFKNVVMNYINLLFIKETKTIHMKQLCVFSLHYL